MGELFFKNFQSLGTIGDMYQNMEAFCHYSWHSSEAIKSGLLNFTYLGKKSGTSASKKNMETMEKNSPIRMTLNLRFWTSVFTSSSVFPSLFLKKTARAPVASLHLLLFQYFGFLGHVCIPCKYTYAGALLIYAECKWWVRRGGCFAPRLRHRPTKVGRQEAATASITSTFEP